MKPTAYAYCAALVCAACAARIARQKGLSLDPSDDALIRAGLGARGPFGVAVDSGDFPLPSWDPCSDDICDICGIALD